MVGEPPSAGEQSRGARGRQVWQAHGRAGGSRGGGGQ